MQKERLKASDIESVVLREGGYRGLSPPPCAPHFEHPLLEMKRLDAFVRAVQARALRLSVWLEHWPSAAGAETDEETVKPRNFPSEVRVLTELLPISTSIEEIQGIRLELERHLTRHRDLNRDEMSEVGSPEASPWI